MSRGWRRLGLLAHAPPPLEWATSHATVPIADIDAPGGPRLLVSARDADGRSHVAAARFDLDRGRVTGWQDKPLLSPGPLGMFDDSGAMASCLVRDGDRILLYYIGWTRSVTVPFLTFVGCAVSDDGGGTFRRVSAAPILERSGVDPFLTTAPWVLREGSVWRMWYASGTGWDDYDGAPLHRYHIRYAESDDGIEWRREGVVCIDYADASEYAITRPCVVRDGDRYRMWFCCRGDAYRIGYAESGDGVAWVRDDRAPEALAPASSGFDTEMAEYPYVYDWAGRRYLLYNGNGYGASGVGLAVFDPAPRSA